MISFIYIFILFMLLRCEDPFYSTLEAPRGLNPCQAILMPIVDNEGYKWNFSWESLDINPESYMLFIGNKLHYRGKSATYDLPGDIVIRGNLDWFVLARSGIEKKHSVLCQGTFPVLEIPFPKVCFEDLCPRVEIGDLPEDRLSPGLGYVFQASQDEAFASGSAIHHYPISKDDRELDLCKETWDRNVTYFYRMVIETTSGEVIFKGEVFSIKGVDACSLSFSKPLEGLDGALSLVQRDLQVDSREVLMTDASPVRIAWTDCLVGRFVVTWFAASVDSPRDVSEISLYVASIDSTGDLIEGPKSLWSFSVNPSVGDREGSDLGLSDLIWNGDNFSILATYGSSIRVDHRRAGVFISFDHNLKPIHSPLPFDESAFRPLESILFWEDVLKKWVLIWEDWRDSTKTSLYGRFASPTATPFAEEESSKILINGITVHNMAEDYRDQSHRRNYGAPVHSNWNGNHVISYCKEEASGMSIAVSTLNFQEDKFLPLIERSVIRDDVPGHDTCNLETVGLKDSFVVLWVRHMMLAAASHVLRYARLDESYGLISPPVNLPIFRPGGGSLSINGPRLISDASGSVYLALSEQDELWKMKAFHLFEFDPENTALKWIAQDTNFPEGQAVGNHTFPYQLSRYGSCGFISASTSRLPSSSPDRLSKRQQLQIHQWKVSS